MNKTLTWHLSAPTRGLRGSSVHLLCGLQSDWTMPASLLHVLMKSETKQQHPCKLVLVHGTVSFRGQF